MTSKVSSKDSELVQKFGGTIFQEIVNREINQIGQKPGNDPNKPKKTDAAGEKLRVQFKNGMILITNKEPMNREQFETFLSQASESEKALYAKVDLKLFEKTKTLHKVDNLMLSDDEFSKWRIDNPKKLFVEIVDGIGPQFYYDKLQMTETEWIIYLKKNPALSFEKVDGKWIEVQKKSESYTVEVKDGFIFINKNKYDWTQFEQWRKDNFEKMGKVNQKMFEQYTKATLEDSKPKRKIGGREVTDAEFQEFLNKNSDVPMRYIENESVYYLYKSQKYTDKQFEEYTKKPENIGKFFKSETGWIVNTYASGNNGGSNSGSYDSQRRITYNSKTYSTSEWLTYVDQMYRKNYYWDASKNDFILVTFSDYDGTPKCNEKPCGSYEDYFNWYKNYVLKIPNWAQLRFQLKSKYQYDDYNKNYLVGNIRMSEQEFNIWKQKHKTVNPVKRGNIYEVRTYTVDGMEMTAEEVQSYILMNPWSGLTFYAGAIKRDIGYSIRFVDGRVILNGQEVSWDYYEKYRNYWLYYGSSEIRNYLSYYDKYAFEQSKKIYYIEGAWQDKAFYDKWITIGNHREWTYQRYLGGYVFYKPLPYKTFEGQEFATEAEWVAWFKSMKRNFEKIPNTDIWVEKTILPPPINLAEYGKNNQGGYGQNAGGYGQNAGGYGQYNMGGTQQNNQANNGFRGPLSPMVYDSAKKIFTDESIMGCGAFNFPGWYFIQKRSLRSLYLSGILSVESGVRDQNVVSEKDYGFTSHTISIVMFRNPCNFQIIEFQGQYIYSVMNPNDDACQAIVAQGNYYDRPTCGANRNPAALSSDIKAMLQRAIWMNIIKKEAEMFLQKGQDCSVTIRTIGTVPPTVIITYSLSFSVGNGVCTFIILEKNRNIGWVTNYASLPTNCKGYLTSRRLIV